MAKGLETLEGEDGGAPRAKGGGLRARLARIDDCFVTRELFLRSDDRIRYLRISAGTQKAAVAVSAIAAVWLLSSTFGTLHLSSVIADKNLEIEQSKSDYAELLEEIRDYEGRFVELTGALDANQAQLLALLEHAPENGGGQSAGQSATAQTGDAGERRSFATFLEGLRGLATQTVMLRDHIANMKTQLDSIQLAKQKVDSAHKQLVERLRDKDVALSDLQTERDTLAKQIAELKTALEAAERNVASTDAINAQAVAQLDEAAERAKHLGEERARIQDELDATRKRLADSKRALSAAKASEAQALAQLGEREGRMEELEAQRERLALKVAGLQESLRGATTQLSEDATLKADFGRNLAELELRLSAMDDEKAELQQRERQLQGALAAADRRANEATRHSEQMTDQMLSLKSQMQAMREEQIALVKQLSKRTNGSVIKAEAFLKKLRLPVEELLQQAEAEEEGGKGGPFVPYPEDSDIDRRQDAHLLSNLVFLDNSIERLEAMRILLDRMPIGTPLNGYRITSGYGKRRDPFNGRKAMHYGIDLVGPYRAPLMTTADGVVTKAGWMAGYGRLVEVEHAFGFKTRYAHLRKISVKVGQRLSRGDEVGQLGNSGRSTGPHLHYEVWYEGKRKNPYHYVKAEIDVLQN